MAAQPPPPSRTASVGPPSAGGMNAPQAATPGAGGNSQQNLNQIVLEYLSKKGYSKTEAMLRRESAHVGPEGQPIFSRIEDKGGKMFTDAFHLLENWIKKSLDLYKPEMMRLLWPVFVYAYLQAVTDCYFNDAHDFFKEFREQFEEEHSDDLAALGTLSEPEHAHENALAKKYRENQYRLTISNSAFLNLIDFLETNADAGGRIILSIIQTHLDIRTVDRSLGGTRGLQKMLEERHDGPDRPAEDEGIPGHHPGSSNLARDASSTGLDKIRTGNMPMESDLMEDVKADLSHEDSLNPPPPGRASLMDTFEQTIKQEPTDDVGPPRDSIPFPPSTARDVAMEVQKVRENRDRFRIEGRTGGVGPGVSVTMFTFHNTFDSVNCIEFSGDNKLVAIGTAESYIRIFSLENKPLVSPRDLPGQQPSSSRRLIGHSGPVYALSFSPSIALPEPTTNGHGGTHASSESQPRYMISCSADSTIRLWSLDTWSNLVVYRGHTSPVWDVRFSPHGHYFVSASADRTARLWSTPEIAPLRMFVGHDSDVETVSWHPNGAYVVTASGVGDRSVRLWELTSGTCKRVYTGHAGNVTATACAPNGRVIASADDKGEILLWDIHSGRLIKRMRCGVRTAIYSLDWSVESSVLVSGGADKAVRVWDVAPIKENTNKVNGEAKTTTDGSTVGGSAAVAKQAKPKDNRTGPTADLISTFYTKQSPVYKVRFTQMNLVMAGGAYLPNAA
ncbi:transcription initiation factor TFIID, subunit TAF5 [Teratosphaeria nubilosa]|uniref:Transcription initiation factor TFIID, subunit TAF5 n=1 Tax=Teratosphaeria nubilosa TaxID=161662 RepID=A0A6G1L001_9PEZI|nr:transcription initiation factor TFIID, subunit TAF5 [Teratosphaeria nubilosa]